MRTQQHLSVLEEVRYWVHEALVRAYPHLEHPERWVEVTRSTNDNFGDYQCNSAMRLGKHLKEAPRTVAARLVDALKNTKPQPFRQIEVAGPGFVNLHLTHAYLKTRLMRLWNAPHFGLPTSAAPQRVVIDFSAPNVAKEMHVGHLRSTILGDCLARVLEFQGHDVLRLNHIGDWGTAFGMLIAYLNEHPEDLVTQDTSLGQLLIWYKDAKRRFDEDPLFKKEAQLAVVALQSGQNKAHQIWELICTISRKAYRTIYDRLGISLIDRGESFYNAMLPDVLHALEQNKMLTLSNGAQCVFVPGFQSKEGTPLPLMVQKSDGGYNYATTDLAALRHRSEEEHADRIIYVTDAGQSMHFSMVFKTARAAGFVPDHVRLDHVPFGLVLGADGKKFKTRSGDTEKLVDLLDEAVARAQILLEARNHENCRFSQEEIKHLGTALGLNAIKYADLSNNRIHDYSFSYEKMLRFEGNTAAFLMYADVRARSILKKISWDPDQFTPTTWVFEHESEERLVKQLMRFQETLEAVSMELMPNRLTDYLFALAECFHEFFRDCRVAGDACENDRAALCFLTHRVMQQGLVLLGLTPVERM